MKKIYVCSPYQGRCVRQNIKNARDYCNTVANTGYLPIAPHLLFTQFLDDAVPSQRAMGMAMGLELLVLCDEVWVFGSRVSEGMAMDIAKAEELGKPIQYYMSTD